MPEGVASQMAISSYLAVFIVLLLTYPVAVVVINLMLYCNEQRKRWSRRINWAYLILILVMLFMHMQTEVFYGRELLDWIQSPNT
ncbi:hypothetical protein A3K86_16785 [Photobacterium jeanii]|uniref:Uncharacterized protein n=1 Tax=Photobacterium jeanii TaxID=858640 RepID=A0A178K7I9_9GAMM|nr:hypothetical protein [Photobacterium jeanii]OAN13308.1 hypothetical protein A3K86_16785 [Photobacterium jeanii]PST90307.1 hypothetical protein C9I91_06565 [Photobacterium jeanii]